MPGGENTSPPPLTTHSSDGVGQTVHLPRNSSASKAARRPQTSRQARTPIIVLHCAGR